MEEKNYISQLPRVKAPEDFENQVLNRLKKEKVRVVRQRRWAWGLGGVAAAVLMAIILIKPGVKQPSYTAQQLEQERSPLEVIQVVEPLNLENEIKTATDDPQTVFILEQVSDRPLIQQVRY
ncbi:MAG TPA: hypothetical protein P5517_04320 [Candidatus Saccharicenans sp.]|jgi:negative regulator of sigma E activity|nr:hypothetical protein [Candidatus Saccharicenans sp.]HOP60762.1 hypothetical protein [Candidatus Saccharicenans sp.]HPP23911.1 hypothetical protein [Candidatus Saccharicenans sp.]HPU94461.1 hypothetical protein [Candidatus Saccharicenans sp.]HRT26131.1 hypothetical protein [Candidatus Saccharicenans sp.]